MSSNPSAVAVKNGNFFGFETSLDKAKLVIVSVPWDVTTSYKDGTSRGPEAILNASYQLDFHSLLLPEAWKLPIATAKTPADWPVQNKKFRALAATYIEFLESGGEVEKNPTMQKVLAEVNAGSAAFHASVTEEINKVFRNDSGVILLGGDHSTSISLFEALSQKGEHFSILHFDAHADLRDCYEGFIHSHASIMHRAMHMDCVEGITQVGIRDVAPDEIATIKNSKKMHTFFDWDLQAASFEGVSWSQQCDKILATLGKNVYVSFDIDGLDPKLCPSTGTPVPGGLEYSQATFLLRKLAESGRRIVGMDLVEVAPGPQDNEWDANVGARVLFNLCVAFFRSQNHDRPSS